ncbi:hypothetical protein FQN57_000436 [Myotisia sp. PD_48]|nr:hypothetical protein FQN57_000436 [Myotisia sp. PD_48]
MAKPNLFILTADNPQAVLPLLRETPSLAAQQDSHGYSLLHAAASYGHPDILRALVQEFHVDVNLTDEDGETCLFVVDSLDMARLLVEELGVDKTILNEEGVDAGEMIGMDGSFPEVAAYLNGTSASNELPPNMKIMVNGVSEQSPGEGVDVDPELKKRIEELVSKENFHSEEGQQELRELVSDALKGVNLDADRDDLLLLTPNPNGDVPYPLGAADLLTPRWNCPERQAESKLEIQSLRQNPSTPPPPPPKSFNRDANRRDTQHAPPLPTTPNPPSTPPKEIISSRLGAYPPVNKNPTSNENSSAAAQSQASSIEDKWIPEILKDKSTVELHALLSNRSMLDALASTHPAHHASEARLQTLVIANKSLASHLLELQSHLENLRKSTETLLLQHQSLELSWRKKQAEMDTALDPWSPKALYQRLVGAVSEQEAICQAVEESFLEESDRQHEKASEREIVEWTKRIRDEGAKLESRKEARARWDEGRVGGWR